MTLWIAKCHDCGRDIVADDDALICYDCGGMNALYRTREERRARKLRQAFWDGVLSVLTFGLWRIR